MLLLLAAIGLIAILTVAMVVDNAESGWIVITALLIVSFLVPEIFPRALTYTGGFSPWQYVSSHLWTFAEYLIAYAMAGIVYIWIRWWFFVRAAASFYKEIAAVDKCGNAFQERYGTTSIPLRVADFKNRITGWGMYWPFSLIALIIDEPLKKFFQMVYNSIRDSLQAMSNNAFKDINTGENK